MNGEEWEWFGISLGGEGTSPDLEKAPTIKQWKGPINKEKMKPLTQTLQSLIPVMQMGSRGTYSDITDPLRQLTNIGVHFKQTEKCQTKVGRLKELIVNDTLLEYYDQRPEEDEIKKREDRKDYRNINPDCKQEDPEVYVDVEANDEKNCQTCVGETRTMMKERDRDKVTQWDQQQNLGRGMKL